MNTNTINLFTALCTAIVVLSLAPMSVFADDSASFRLYNQDTDTADAVPLGSNSYSLTEGGETWVAYPVASGNYQIVTAPPVRSSASSAASSQGSSQQVSLESTGGSGGGSHRGARTNEKTGVLHTAARSSSSSSARIDLPEQYTEEWLSTHVPLEQQFPVSGLNAPLQYELAICETHVFNYVDREADCQNILSAAPNIETKYILVPTVFHSALPSLLMLLCAFLLGYTTRHFRKGNIIVPKKRLTQKKK